MRAFLEPLRSLEEMEKLRAQLRKEPGIRMVSGCIDPQKPHLMYGLGNDFKYKVIVTFNEQKHGSSVKNIGFLSQARCIIQQRIFCFTSQICGAMY